MAYFKLPANCYLSFFGSNSILTRLSTFASKTPAVAGVLLIGLHDTAFRDAIREDSRQTTPSRGVTPRKKFAVEANVESRAKVAEIVAKSLDLRNKQFLRF